MEAAPDHSLNKWDQLRGEEHPWISGPPGARSEGCPASVYLQPPPPQGCAERGGALWGGGGGQGHFDSQNFASAPSVPRGFKLTNFWSALGGGP